MAAISAVTRGAFGPDALSGPSTQPDASVHEHARAEESWQREMERLSRGHQQEIDRLRQTQAAETEQLTLQHRQDTARLQAISRAEYLRLESVWREQTERLDSAWQGRLKQQVAEQQAFTDRLRTEHLHAQQRLEASYRSQLVDMSARVTGMLDRLSELETSKQALVQSLGVKPPITVMASAKPANPAPTTINTAPPVAAQTKSAQLPQAQSKAPPSAQTKTVTPAPTQPKAPPPSAAQTKSAPVPTGPSKPATSKPTNAALPAAAATDSKTVAPSAPAPNGGKPSAGVPVPAKPSASVPSNAVAAPGRAPGWPPLPLVGGQGGPMKWPPLFQPHETSLAEQLDDATHRLSEMDLALASIQAQWRRDFSRIEQLPVALPLRVDFKISSGFGVRSDPFNGQRAMHEGVDLIARHGSPVLATASGVVTRSGRAGAHGQMIEIRHAEGWVTRYAHLSRRLVVEGERVERGEIIGHLGNTGRSSGAHLHYELEHHGRILDPLRALGSLAWSR
jgi:murein DD-endopeptidase MepM/ murein hydrolase activator NlpD